MKSANNYRWSPRAGKKVVRKITSFFFGEPQQPQLPMLPPPAPIEEPVVEEREDMSKEVQRREELVKQESMDRARQRKGRLASIIAGKSGGLGSSKIQTVSKQLLGE